MRTLRNSLLGLLAFIIWVTESFALDLDVTPTQLTYDYFPVSSFDFVNPEFSPLIFTFQITGGTAGENVKVEMEIDVTSSVFTGKIATGEGTIALDASGNKAITNGELFKAFKGNYSFDDATSKLLEKYTLEAALIPSGTMTMTFTVPQNGNEITKIITVTIQNNSQLTLSTPSGDVFTTFPTFQWSSDLSDFDLIISETYSDPLGESGTSNFNSIINPAQKDLISGTTFQFPAQLPAGGNHLETGKTYFWQVVGNRKTPSGKSAIRSEIGSFTIKNAENVGINDKIGNVLNTLTDGNKGPNNIISLEDILNLINNSTFTGANLGNQTLSYEDFLALLNSFLNDPDKYNIISLTIE
ncbi:hypothetical protein IT568_06480 [bacterium]|nr:hypothetical protein [bacterium]